MKRHSEGCFFIVLVRVLTFQWLFHGKTDIVTRVNDTRQERGRRSGNTQRIRGTHYI